MNRDRRENIVHSHIEILLNMNQVKTICFYKVVECQDEHFPF